MHIPPRPCSSEALSASHKLPPPTPGADPTGGLPRWEVLAGGSETPKLLGLGRLPPAPPPPPTAGDPRGTAVGSAGGWEWLCLEPGSG